MRKITMRAVSGALLTATVGLMLGACTTVVHDRQPVEVVKERPSTVIVPERSPDVVVVPPQ